MDQPGLPDDTRTGRLRLGRLVLDLHARELLTDDGQLAGLRRQALEVLLLLGTRAGQVVGKDELMQRVWPDVVVGDGSLTQAIADIRRVLGDTEHRLVRNVARRGYLLVPDAGAQTADGAASGTAAAAAPSDPRTLEAVATAAVGTPPTRAQGRRTRPVVTAVATLLLLAAGGWVALRPQSPAWLSPVELTRVPAPGEAPPLSIIVLPLSVEGDALEARWLADALHGDLILAVSRQHNSLVVARDTAATYKDKVVDPRLVAREMGVRHVVRGSLRHEGTRIQLSVVLIDGDSGAQRWAETFSAGRAELPQTVGDFAVAIERSLTPALYRATVERRAALDPSQVTADDLAMQGIALWYRGVTRENVLGARALFERALELDPNSARAWAGIQYTTTNQLLNSWTDDRAGTARRHDEAVANLERLDPDGTYTYSGKTMRFYLKRDFQAMLPHTAEWTERYRMPLAFGAHGVALILNGRFDDAVPVIERALRLGPRDPFRAEWQYRLALAHFGAGRYELARDWSQSAANVNAQLSWPPIHAAALLHLGQREAAQQAFDEHMRRHPGFTAAQIAARMPSEVPAYVEMRKRLVDGLRTLGLRER